MHGQGSNPNNINDSNNYPYNPAGMVQHDQPYDAEIYEQNQKYLKYQRYPVRVVCHNCYMHIDSEPKQEIGTKQWVAAALLCFFGCCCLTPVPCCFKECYEYRHFCPQCDAFLGTSHTGDIEISTST